MTEKEGAEDRAAIEAEAAEVADAVMHILTTWRKEGVSDEALLAGANGAVAVLAAALVGADGAREQQERARATIDANRDTFDALAAAIAGDPAGPAGRA